ncbi:SRPBCC family protein [Nocardia puris]|uniref:Polyketide cyclase/dehydrase/lipid transport protein n=1 Tax=Nocardia puris TaxID=208602 RepID=A0A366D2B5_9NOCA|nr:SRPBCC family protein [Nocardia puris]MBF6213903.1 SRPBCC family protein [Nocardia puris]MBF6368542.1 SRPBCC family protein [Nocardia puris]MBF6463029.1 SRPBCC family protein [Nocardia puris]RBO84227.1 polyketide cyclase/dehydrase/lipid transport protein [Nocardia puris]
MRTKTDIRFAVEASPAQVLDAVAAIDMLPEWSMYQDARVATRDRAGRPHRVYVTADVLGSQDLQVLEYEWTADRASWQVVDSSRGIRGGGWFEVSEGPEGTEVWYHAELHSRIPLPGLLMKRTVQRWNETVVQNFIEFAESYPETEKYSPV